MLFCSLIRLVFKMAICICVPPPNRQGLPVQEAADKVHEQQWHKTLTHQACSIDHLRKVKGLDMLPISVCYIEQ